MGLFESPHSRSTEPYGRPMTDTRPQFRYTLRLMNGNVAYIDGDFMLEDTPAGSVAIFVGDPHGQHDLVQAVLLSRLGAPIEKSPMP